MLYMRRLVKLDPMIEKLKLFWCYFPRNCPKITVSYMICIYLKIQYNWRRDHVPPNHILHRLVTIDWFLNIFLLELQIHMMHLAIIVSPYFTHEIKLINVSQLLYVVNRKHYWNICTIYISNTRCCTYGCCKYLATI